MSRYSDVTDVNVSSCQGIVTLLMLMLVPVRARTWELMKLFENCALTLL